MKTSELVFVGINGSVLALNRATGDQVWATHLKGSDFVNVVFERDHLYAMTYGEIFCLDPLTGEGLWHNKLRGFGTGLATVATQPAATNVAAITTAEQQNRDQAAASTTST